MIVQRSKEWYEQRSGRITGSIAGACLGQSTHTTPKKALRQMVRDFHGEPSEKKDNHIFAYGRFCERLAKDALIWETGLKIKDCGFFEFEDWLGASPDGLEGDDFVYESKCPWKLRDCWINPEFDEISAEYYAQIQIEMFCTGRPKGLFFQWCPGGYKKQIIDRDNRWLNDHLPILKDFHNTFKKELRNLAHLQPLPKRGKKSAT
jgi:putative phage-type endonuclease